MPLETTLKFLNEKAIISQEKRMEIGRNQNIYVRNVTHALMPSSNPRGRTNPSTLLNSLLSHYHFHFPVASPLLSNT